MADILHTTSADEVDFDAIEDAIQLRKRNQDRIQSEREMHANTHAHSGSEDDEPGKPMEIDDSRLYDDDDIDFSILDGKFTYDDRKDPRIEREVDRMDTIPFTRPPRRTRNRHKPISTENWSYIDIYDHLGDDGDWGDLGASAESPEPPEVRYGSRRTKKSRKPWWEIGVEEKTRVDDNVLNRILKQLANLQEKLESVETCLEDFAVSFGDLDVKIDTIEEKVDEIREKICFE